MAMLAERYSTQPIVVLNQGLSGERAEYGANGYRAFVEHWSESAVLPRYLDVVKKAAIAKGRHDVVARLESGP